MVTNETQLRPSLGSNNRDNETNGFRTGVERLASNDTTENVEIGSLSKTENSSISGEYAVKKLSKLCIVLKDRGNSS